MQRRQVRKMADISKEINDFREAVYGEEVRGSMISLAEKVNDETENSTQKVTEYGEAEAAREKAENNRKAAEMQREQEYDQLKNELEQSIADANAAALNANEKANAANSAANDVKRMAYSGDFSASVEIGQVTTGEPGSAAEVTNSGDNKDAVLNFKIPQGPKGDKGDTGPEGPKGDTGSIEDVSNAPITFSQALQRANIESGDTLAVAFGKLAKYCADLQDHAFAAPVNNLAGTNPELPLAAPQGKVLQDKIDELNSALVAPSKLSEYAISEITGVTTDVNYITDGYHKCIKQSNGIRIYEGNIYVAISVIDNFTIATLPEEYRPIENIICPVYDYANNEWINLQILPSGVVRIMNMSFQSLSQNIKTMFCIRY